MIHIALVSPYPELTDLARSLVAQCRARGIQLEIFEAIGAEAASRLHIRADISICRGVTGVALRKVLAPEIPMVELSVTGYDVMQAIHECRSNPDNPKPYVVIGTRQMVNGLQRMQAILDCSPQVHIIGSEHEARSCLETCLRQGPCTVIGGSTIVGVAQSRGIAAVLIRSCEESLLQAIDEAFRMASLLIQERAAVEQTRISLDSLAEGIIMLDVQGLVTDCNTAAVHLLLGDKGKRAGVLGRAAADFLPGPDMRKVLAGQEAFSLVQLGKGHTVAVNRFPVLVKGVCHGAVATLKTVSQVQELEGNIRHSLLNKGHRAKYSFEHCLGADRNFLRALDRAKMYSLTQASVLLYGETGTGKEIVAQSIHNAGQRRHKSFVAVNCASFPEGLLESMLFGYVKGAFTGAAQEGRPGFFELAHGGTLFLDELSEIPLYLQGRLLRVLQEQEVMRLGHDRVIPVDVRIIAATNRPLLPLIERGLFRWNLFYRLNILGLTLPPLRERRDDVEILTRHFLLLFCKKNGRRQIDLSPAAWELLRQYPWPGNIRELRNFCERIGVTARTAVIEGRDVCEALEMGTPDAGGANNCGPQDALSAMPSALSPAMPSDMAYGVPPVRAGGRDRAACGPDELGTEHQGDAGTTGDTGTPTSAAVTPNIRELTLQAAQQALIAAGGNKSMAAQRLGVSRTTLWRILQEQKG